MVDFARSHTGALDSEASAAAPLDLPERFDEVIEDLHVVRLPMVTRFRGITEREVVLFSGTAGWAEFSPFVEYGTEEASRWLRASLEFSGLIPRPTALAEAASSTDSVRGSAPAAEANGETVAVNGTLPACPPDQVESILSRYGRVGTVKAKVAEHGFASLDEDLARLREFRKLFPDTTLRLDANAGYTPSEAIEACEAFADFGLQYFEQPVPEVEQLADLREELARRGLPIVIAADESIRKAEDPLRVAELGAAEVIIVKVQPLGGIGAALDVIGASGLPAVVSSALESSVGLAAGAELAARLPRTDRSLDILGDRVACGLGTGRLFTADVVAEDEALTPVDGAIPVTRIVPDPDRLEQLAVDPGRFEWWAERLQNCWSAVRDLKVRG
ncbi:O-succinylbenzoate synthase [Brevibacterium siliguriense]|uniref:o-succinylbenzoate synthase n=1 Tax=Brevibacterium siliguriense TaxID=1136497 RepID=A0A1H1WWG5_9MICO|nr:o-succinylbenzoate synthase [Brevibacterium siliguriense]SDT00696.1 O-succinylbenzoate synthase [Brevibacterium siliguriense]